MSNLRSDYSTREPAVTARPVSLITIAFLMVLFAAFLLVVRKFYRPAETASFQLAAENLPDEAKWKATPASRRAVLQEEREKAAAQASAYAWIDRPSGRIQLPIERAMELTVQDYRGKR